MQTIHYQVFDNLNKFKVSLCLESQVVLSLKEELNNGIVFVNDMIGQLYGHVTLTM